MNDMKPIFKKKRKSFINSQGILCVQMMGALISIYNRIVLEHVQQRVLKLPH